MLDPGLCQIRSYAINRCSEFSTIPLFLSYSNIFCLLLGWLQTYVWVGPARTTIACSHSSTDLSVCKDFFVLATRFPNNASLVPPYYDSSWYDLLSMTKSQPSRLLTPNPYPILSPHSIIKQQPLPLELHHVSQPKFLVCCGEARRVEYWIRGRSTIISTFY